MDASGCILNQEEGGDIASGADRFVVNSLNVERVGGKEVSALAVGNDVIQRDFTVEVRVGSEGVVIGVSNLGDEAVGSGETKDDEGLGFTRVRIGVTGEEISWWRWCKRVSSVPAVREALTPVRAGTSLTAARLKELAASVESMPSVTL